MKYLRVVKKTARSCRIVYLIMSAVHDLVEKPKEEDHTFKPRQPNPNQWKIFQGPGRDCHGRRKMTHDSHDAEEDSDRPEEYYVSNMADARLAATSRALQNLRHSWNEGWI